MQYNGPPTGPAKKYSLIIHSLEYANTLNVEIVDDSDLKIGIGIQFYSQNKEFLCVIGYIKTNLFFIFHQI